MPQDEAQLRFYHKIWRTISFQSTAVTSSPSSPITTSSAEGQSPVANYIGQQQQMQQVESVHEEVLPMDDHDTEDQEALQRYHENGYSEVDEKKTDATTGVLQQNGVKSTTTTTEATQVKNCLITSPSPPLGVTFLFAFLFVFSFSFSFSLWKRCFALSHRQLHQSWGPHPSSWPKSTPSMGHFA